MTTYNNISQQGLIPVKVENQGSLITTQVNKINFTGSGVITTVGNFNNVNVGIDLELDFVSYSKDADQNISGGTVVTFPTSSELIGGESFGSMASTGVFTFTKTGNYLITISYNTSANGNPAAAASLDIWGKVNDSDSPRYTQIKSTGIFKSSVTEVIPITNINDNFRWYSYGSCTVYGTGDTKTRINIVKLS